MTGQHNIGHICTRAQCDLGRADKIALRWITSAGERSAYTFHDLERRSNAFANALESLGFGPGDVLLVALPKTPALFFATLGALKARVAVAFTFSRIGEPGLVERLGAVGARGLLTTKKLARQVSGSRSALPRLQQIMVVDAEPHPSAGVLSLESLAREASEDYTSGRTDAAAPSILHFTPGETAGARAAVHVHGAIDHIAATSREVLQLGPDETFWCTADHGWVTGTSYGIIGPWSLGVTQVHYGGGFTPETWMGLLAREAVSVWYTAPTVLRMLMRESPSLFAAFDLSKLKHVFCVGEWLNPHVLQWAREVLGREPYDTYFQTETGGIVISNRPGLKVRAGSMGQPVAGIEAVVADGDGRELPPGAEGRLCLKPGWPSMLTGYATRGGEQPAKRTGRYYDTGDLAWKDDDGYVWFRGRRDDVINTAGHLVGPADVERALLESPDVAACAVVGIPDDILLEKVAALVVLEPGVEASDEVELNLRLLVTRQLSPIEAPQELRFVDALPADAEGRVVRGTLRPYFAGPGGPASSVREDS